MTGPDRSSPTIHVADARRASWALLHGLALLSERTDHRILLFGNSADTRRARAAGVQRFRSLQARANEPRHASRQLHALLASHRSVARVLAWDDRAHDALSRANIRSHEANFFQELPGVFPKNSLDRTTTRRGWGLNEDTRVIIPASDHPDSTDAMRLAYIAGILSVAGTPTVAIAHSAARGHDRAARFTWRHGRARWLIVDDRSPLFLRDAADAFWWQQTTSTAGIQTAQMLVRAGLPGAADRTPQSERLPSDRLRLCDPEKDLAPTSVLGGKLDRGTETPDHDALVRAVESLTNDRVSLAAS